MSRLGLLLVLACAVAATLGSPVLQRAVPYDQIAGRIINGSPASLGQFPWQVALYSATGTGTSFCGGSLINARWVLTAAHCVSGVRTVDVHLGLITLNSAGRVEIRASRIIVHANWNPSTIQNDVAVLDLGQNVPTSANIRTIPLATAALGNGVALTVSGWGRTSDSSNSISQTLNHVNLNSIANTVCAQTYGSIITNGVVCATGATTQSTCNGDSGGPLITGSGNNAQQVGIVSFGSSQGCARGFPSAYSRVAYFRSWISQNCGGCV